VYVIQQHGSTYISVLVMFQVRLFTLLTSIDTSTRIKSIYNRSIVVGNKHCEILIQFKFTPL